MPNRRLLMSAVAIAISFGGLALAADRAEAAPTQRMVNASNIKPGHVAWIRSGPGIAYSKVGYLRAVSRHIRTMECKLVARDTWCHVEFRGTRGWVQDHYLRAPHVMSG